MSLNSRCQRKRVNININSKSIQTPPKPRYIYEYREPFVHEIDTVLVDKPVHFYRTIYVYRSPYFYELYFHAYCPEEEAKEAFEEIISSFKLI